MLPRQIIPVIKYNGKDISSDLSPFLESISYTDNLSGYADDISINLDDRRGLWEGDWFPDRGATLEVSLISRNWGSLLERTRELKIGMFALDSIDGSSPPRVMELKGTSVPENNNLRGVERTKSWEKAEMKTIANDVAQGAGMELVYDCSDNPSIDRAEQTEQSDLSFLLKLCEDHGMAIKICNNQIVIFDEADYEKKEPKITIVRPGMAYIVQKNMTYITNITGYRMHAVTRDIYKACHVQCNDTDSGSNIEATFTDPSKSEGKTLQVKEQVKSIAEAERLAKKKLREKNREEVTMSIDSMGNFNLFASETVNLFGFGRFDGKYIIVTAKHDIGNGYTTSIDLRRCLDGY